MEFNKFKKMLLTLQVQSDVVSELNMRNVDLVNFVAPYEEIIEGLMKEIYGEEAYDWWSWFCYDNDYGMGELTAHDADNNPICYDIKSLWEYMETLKK